MEQFTQTEILLGKAATEKLQNSSVAVFGIGGVGGYVAEALARGGIGKFLLIDGDIISPSNINRQLIAVKNTVGMSKVEVMKKRIKDINPHAKVIAENCFYGADNADIYDLSGYSYIVDAIDTVTSKLILVQRAKEVGVPIISSMGAGNKLDPTQFETADIYETSCCPLARVMRRELRARGIENLKVVYSKEPPIKPQSGNDETRQKAPGSISFVPSVAGLIIAGEVIKDLIGSVNE